MKQVKIVPIAEMAEEKQGRLRNTLDENGNRLVIKPWDDRTIAYMLARKEFQNYIKSKVDENFSHSPFKGKLSAMDT